MNVSNLFRSRQCHYLTNITLCADLLLILVSVLLFAACGTLTRWPATALHCDNDDLCHAVQEARIVCRDSVLAALRATNIETWHQNCGCTILSDTYSPSAIAINYDPIIEIVDRDATRRLVACFANTHAVILSPLEMTDDAVADANCRRAIRSSCAPLLTAIAAASKNPSY